MTKYLLVSSIAVALSATAALGQTPAAPAAKSTATPPVASSATAPAGQTTGMRMANTATMTIKFATVKPADLMSSKLIGVNVYNNQNESVGEIEDISIENGKTISAVIVSVGGFLGIGESYVALDPSTLVVSENDGTWKAFVNTSKDDLKNAPKFTYNKKKS